MAFGSASERLAFILQLDASGAIRGFKQVGDSADRNLGAVDNRLDRLGGKMQVAGAGAVLFAGVAGRALYGFAQASEDANLAQVKLQNSIENSPELAGETADRFLDLADAIQSVTAADGDAVVAAEAMLGTFHLTGDEIERVTPLVVDYARKFDVDLVSAATQVGKALSGNIATLQRNGIVIDENAYATDRFNAVTTALRENVGGFAEQEGATFAGSMERLKNELGDVAEGIGVGVVDAFSRFVGVADPVLDRLTGMSSTSQAQVGTFAAYGAATLGAAGSLSYLGGVALRARDRFSTLGVDGVRSLTLLGKAASGIALVGLAASIYELANASNEWHGEVDELNRRLIENERDTLRALYAAQQFAGGWDDLAGDIANRSVPAAERLLDSLTRHRVELGVTKEELGAVATAIDRKKESDVQATVDQRNYNAEVEAGVSATEAGASATDDLTDATETNADATKTAAETEERLNRALEERKRREDEIYGAVTSLFEAERSHRDAQRQSIDVLNELDQITRDHGDSSWEARDAVDRASEAMDRQARAAVELFEQTAILNGETLTAEQKATIHRQALEKIADTLAPGSPLRKQLDTYIWQLATIPRQITTDLVLRGIDDVGQRIRDGLAGVSGVVDLFGKSGGAAPVNVVVNAYGRLTTEEYAAAREAGRAAGREALNELGVRVN